MIDRSRFIGGSDASAILGLSPWKTPLQLFLEKTKQAEPETIDEGRAKALRRGHRLEPYVLDMLREEQGLQIARRNERYIDSEHPFLAAEIDFEPIDGRNGEIKTVSPWKAKEWGEPGEDACPVYYVAQAQHGMMVRPAPETVLAALIGTDDFRVYRIKRDEEAIAMLREREVAFWQGHVLPRVPPEPVNADDVLRRWPRDDGATVEASEGIIGDVVELRNLLAHLKQMEAEKERIADRLREAFGPAAVLVDAQGKPLATYKTQTAQRFDQRAFGEAHPQLLAEFKRASESRVLRIR